MHSFATPYSTGIRREESLGNAILYTNAILYIIEQRKHEGGGGMPKKSRNEGRTHDVVDNKGSSRGTHDVYENK
jgi:hypothetical protein